MASVFEPSMSTSLIRPSASASVYDAPSMAESLPSINFGFDELRERMAAFTERFDVFIANGRQRVLTERNEHRKRMAELEDLQRTKRQDLDLVAQTTSQHQASLAAQATETAEMEAAIASMTERRDAHLSHRDNLRSEIRQLQKQVSQRQAAQAAHGRGVDAQARLNAPELTFWETYLGLRIEGVGQADRLKFCFDCVCERDWNREAWFELDTERTEYRVVAVRPQVPDGEVRRCVDELNGHRDLGVFLKEMRLVFTKAMR